MNQSNIQQVILLCEKIALTLHEKVKLLFSNFLKVTIKKRKGRGGTCIKDPWTKPKAGRIESGR